MKLLADPPCTDLKVIGCRQHLAGVAQSLNLPFPGDEIIDLPLPEPIEVGEVSAVAGAHSFDCLEAAVEGTLSGAYRGVVTNPIHKEAWHLAGKPYPAHTEYLADKTRTTSHAMMLTSEEITCSLVTTHVPLQQVSELIREGRILEVITLTHKAMSAIHGRPARLAMPGLNPHAGEAGLFGREEIDLIIPVLEKARARGIDIRGPLSPDTAFLPALRREIDAFAIPVDSKMIDYLTRRFGIAVQFVTSDQMDRDRVWNNVEFNESTKVFHIEDSAPAAGYRLQIARLICRFALRKVLDTLVETSPLLRSDEARSRAQGALASYGAACLLMPSLYEGFGFPVLEAMACGTPVVCSSASSLPEAAGDAALLVEPTDAEALAAAVARVLGDPALAEQMRADGLAQAGLFRWERTAAETVAVYQNFSH